MDTLISDELREFRRVLRKFFASECTPSFVRQRLLGDPIAVSPGGLEEQQALESVLWSQLATCGAFTSMVPKQYKGLGFGFLAAQTIVEESARVLSPLPVFETVALGVLPLLAVASTEQKDKILPGIANGKQRLSGSVVDFLIEGQDVSLRTNQDFLNGGLVARGAESLPGVDFTHTLHGILPLIPSLNRVDALLVPACTEETCDEADGEDPALYLLPIKGQPKNSVRTERVPTLDLVREYSKLELKGARATQVSQGQVSSEQWRFLALRTTLLQVAELVGVAERVVPMTIDYLKERRQFDRVLGSFQALQHKLADMYTRVEEVASLVRFAAWCSESERDQFEEVVIAASGYASEVIPEVVEEALQLHGGVGFMYEHELHLYLRRARVAAALCGSRSSYLNLGNMMLNQ